jgi:hypothetical protein
MMTDTDPVRALLLTADFEGARLWPDGGNVHYRAPGPLSAELRELVAAHKPALLVALATWDGAGAVRLQHLADGVFAACGCSGRDPMAFTLAGQVVAAAGRADMAGVRCGCAKLEEWARKDSRKRGAAA